MNFVRLIGNDLATLQWQENTVDHMVHIGYRVSLSDKSGPLESAAAQSQTVRPLRGCHERRTETSIPDQPSNGLGPCHLSDGPVLETQSVSKKRGRCCGRVPSCRRASQIDTTGSLSSTGCSPRNKPASSNLREFLGSHLADCETDGLYRDCHHGIQFLSRQGSCTWFSANSWRLTFLARSSAKRDGKTR